MHGQRVIDIVCHVCKKPMPDLVDDHGWDYTECKCGNWYDVPTALKNGGKLIG